MAAEREGIGVGGGAAYPRPVPTRSIVPMKAIYTATATSEGGGREGHVRADTGRIDLELTRPKEMGGTGVGSNPEELFAAGYSACFHGAMHFVADQKKQPIPGTTVEGHVSIGANEHGKGFMIGVRHVVRVPALSQADAEALVAEAHEVCPYSNATRGNVDVQFEVHGA